jgi:hypothetical protein
VRVSRGRLIIAARYQRSLEVTECPLPRFDDPA